MRHTVLSLVSLLALAGSDAVDGDYQRITAPCDHAPGTRGRFNQDKRCCGKRLDLRGFDGELIDPGDGLAVGDRGSHRLAGSLLGGVALGETHRVTPA